MSISLARRRTLCTILWLYGVALVWLCLDQLTKALVLAALSPDSSLAVLGPVLSLTRRTNTGGAFSLLQGCPAALITVSIVTLLAILGLGPRLAGSRTDAAVGLGLVAGGATGNLLDRLRLGYVVDFLDFHFWPVFNVADIGIVVGAALVVVAVVTTGRTGATRDHQQGTDGR